MSDFPRNWKTAGLGLAAGIFAVLIIALAAAAVVWFVVSMVTP